MGEEKEKMDGENKDRYMGNHMGRVKRGQSQVIDMMIAFSILFVALIAIFSFFSFYSARLQENIAREDLHEKAFTFTDILLSEGKPKDWNYSNVQIMGLERHQGYIEPGKFNALRFYVDYEKAKNLSGLNGFQFYINLTKFDGSAIGGYGSVENVSGKEVISLRRVLFYGMDNARLEVRIWRGETSTCTCQVGSRRCAGDGSALEECTGTYPTCWSVVQQCAQGCVIGGVLPAPTCGGIE